MNVATFLQDRDVDFAEVPHAEAHDSQRLAATIHESGKRVAKTVLLRADHGFAYVVAVVPSHRSIDLAQASEALGGSDLAIASELEVVERCPDCECGVLPPFGSQYGMQTLLDKSLTNEETIVFEGNSHDKAIRMRVEDFRKLEQPLVASIVG